MSAQFNLEIRNPEALPHAAGALLKCFPFSRVFVFYAEMGVGKTTFIKALCEALGTTDALSSPTYSLVNEYSIGDKVIYHMDLYRLNSLEEALDMGIEDYLSNKNAHIFIEWPQLIETLLPLDVVKVFIETEENGLRRVNAY